MPIATLDGYIASAKQQLTLAKTAARTTVAAAWFSVFDLAGNPGAGVLAGISTAAGVVPSGSAGTLTAGVPVINNFGASAQGYLSLVDFGNAVAARMVVADCLFKAGAYAFNAAQALAAQPSYASRIPLQNAVADYTGTQIWIEAVTAFTGNPSVAVNYTNQAGVAGRSTGVFATGNALTAGRMMQLPLQAGDTGVQKIESVTATVATVGTFNVLVLRPLWTGRARLANDGDVHGLDRTGLPQVFDNSAAAGASALMLLVNADSTSTGVPEVWLEIANG